VKDTWKTNVLLLSEHTVDEVSTFE